MPRKGSTGSWSSASVRMRNSSARAATTSLARRMRRQVSVSKTLDRRSKETLGFNIQVEKPIFKEAGQSRAYSGLADTADASEEYAHVAAFDKSRAISRLGSYKGFVGRAFRQVRRAPASAGSVVRIPASEIESRVAQAIGAHLAVQASTIVDRHINHGVLGGNQAIAQREQTRCLRRTSRPRMICETRSSAPRSAQRRLKSF